MSKIIADQMRCAIECAECLMLICILQRNQDLGLAVGGGGTLVLSGINF